MPNPMPDSPFMISPSGVLVDTNYNTAPQAGIGSNINLGSPRVVSVPLPGAPAHLRGIGDFPLSGTFSGRRGTIEAAFTTGPTGTIQAVACLGVSPGAVPVIGIFLSALNKPYALIYNNAGAIVGNVAALGATLAAGTLLRIRLSWNSEAAISVGAFASFRLNGELYPASNWSASPIAAWTPFTPTLAQVGVPNAAGPTALAFAGTLHSVQISETVTL